VPRVPGPRRERHDRRSERASRLGLSRLLRIDPEGHGRPAALPRPEMIVELIQNAIRNSGTSRYAISTRTGIGQDHLCHFLKGESSLSLAAVDKVLDALGLEIVIRPRRTRKGE